MTDREAWELAERLIAKAPEGVRYEPRRTTEPSFPQEKPPQLELGQSYKPVTPWYVARVADKNRSA